MIVEICDKHHNNEKQLPMGAVFSFWGVWRLSESRILRIFGLGGLGNWWVESNRKPLKPDETTAHPLPSSVGTKQSRWCGFDCFVPRNDIPSSGS
jgi:hypothetical protein